ncbi:MAG: phosphate ABC transporter, permease protein PstA, partial [Gemmatimonadota bacterium]
HELAASGIVVLLIVLLSMNAVAIFLRNRFQNRGIE